MNKMFLISTIKQWCLQMTYKCLHMCVVVSTLLIALQQRNNKNKVLTKDYGGYYETKE